MPASQYKNKESRIVHTKNNLMFMVEYNEIIHMHKLFCKFTWSTVMQESVFSTPSSALLIHVRDNRIFYHKTENVLDVPTK